MMDQSDAERAGIFSRWTNRLQVLSDLEAELPAVVKRKEATEQVGYETTTREVDEILSRIEVEVSALTSQLRSMRNDEVMMCNDE
eukprot:160465-Prorocentrum_minimum.AAC.1